MIFIKNGIIIFITVTSSDLKKYIFSMYLICGHIGITKKITSSFREGGRGQQKSGGLKPPKIDDVIF